MKKFLPTLLSIVVVMVLVFGMSGQSAAYLIGGPDIITAPASVMDDPIGPDPGATNDHQQAFDEKQDVLLTSNVEVDGGLWITEGTWVSSHMIFLNTPQNPDGSNQGASDLNVLWAFDGEILGVMSNGNGSLEIASTPLLGLDTTVYPDTPFPARGMESNDGYTISGNTIEVSMSVTEPGDWIRVVTKSTIPEPGTMLLLGLGLIGLAGLRRKLKK